MRKMLAALVALGGRVTSSEEPAQILEFDLRDQHLRRPGQWVAARLYEGKTTNFCTAGGAFSPVYEGPTDGPANLLSTVCVPAPRESRLFLLNSNEVQPLANDRYVALARGETVGAEFAGHSFILIDWYLRLACGQPETVLSETCSWLVFDNMGAIDPQAAHAIDVAGVPTEAQWAKIRVLIFGQVRPIADKATTA